MSAHRRKRGGALVTVRPRSGGPGYDAGHLPPRIRLVAASPTLIPCIRGSEIAGAFLDGVNVKAVGLMLAVTWQLGRAAVVDPLTGGIGALSALFSFTFG
jgi:chromate transport protein ChrA